MTKTTPISIGGLVLCGGDSRRMGQSKAWLMLNGQSILERVVTTVSSVCSEVVVAGRSGKSLPPLSIPVRYAYDDSKYAGPLAGMAAGMTLLEPTCDAVIVVACDHPLVQTKFLQALIDALGDEMAVVPEYEDRAYPLLGVYRISTLSTLKSQLASKNFRAMDFVRDCGAKLISAKDVAHEDGGLMSLKNVNTPEDWQRIQHGK